MQAKHINLHPELIHALRSTFLKEDFLNKKYDKKSRVVNFRTTEKEHQKITEKANMYSMSVSQYVRAISLNLPVESKVDQLAFLEIAKCRADLARIGNLFKLAIQTKDERVNQKSFKELEERIKKHSEELLIIAKKLLK